MDYLNDYDNTAERHEEVDYLLFDYDDRSRNCGFYSRWYRSIITVSAKSFKYLETRFNSQILGQLPKLVQFNCLERYMEFAKAVYFGDGKVVKRLLNRLRLSVEVLKSVGRQVEYFDRKEWDQMQYKVLEVGFYEKISCSSIMKEALGTC
jgi:predicted NAD-dependent protein-ADP-ribosyltransferase YbiA (DUF1768 family)